MIPIHQPLKRSTIPFREFCLGKDGREFLKLYCEQVNIKEVDFGCTDKTGRKIIYIKDLHKFVTKQK